jgi:hypothetical protein
VQLFDIKCGKIYVGDAGRKQTHISNAKCVEIMLSIPAINT